MTPKTYFEKVFKISDEVESKRRERNALRETVLGSTAWEDNPTFSNQFHSPVESTAFKLFEVENEINEKIDRLFDLKARISTEIDQLDDRRYRILLRERYIRCKSWKDIANEREYDERYVYELHGYALDEFKRKFPDKFHKHMFSE